ncbi:MAG: MFS transporter [bacterium]
MAADAEPPDSEAPDGVLRGNPRVTTLVVANTISTFGSAVAMLAFTFVSYQLTGTLLASVVIMAASALPALLLMRPAASITQRFDLRWLAAVNLVLRGSLFFVVAGIVALGDLSYGLLLLTSVASGILGAFYFPVNNEMIRLIAPQGRVSQLDAVISSSNAVAGIVGVIAGGIMLDACGPASLFVVNGISYLVLAAAMGLFRPLRAVAGGTGRSSMREAFAVMRDVSLLRRFVLVAVIVQLVAWPIFNLLPGVSTSIGSNAVIFSLLLSSLYVGMALVAPILRIREKQYSHWHIAMVALVILMIATALMALAPLLSEGLRLVLVMLVLIPLGMALNMTSVVVTAAVQTSAPEEKEAEVLAAFSALITVATPIGALIIAGIADSWSVWAALVIEAVGIGCLLAYLSTPRMRAALAHVLTGKEHVLSRHALHRVTSHPLPADVPAVQGTHAASGSADAGDAARA